MVTFSRFYNNYQTWFTPNYQPWWNHSDLQTSQAHLLYGNQLVELKKLKGH